MENFNQASEMAIDLSYNFMKDRMKELHIKQYQLAEMIGISEKALISNFKKKSDMSLPTYFKICGALELRPYLIPSEMDQAEFQRIFFN